MMAPTISTVREDVVSGDVSITFGRAMSLFSDPVSGRPLASAFYFNGEEALQPDSAWIIGTTVVLRPPEELNVTTVSYVPSKNYPGTTTLFQGPWLVDEMGVGALSFADVPVIPSSVQQEERVAERVVKVIRWGEAVASDLTVDQISLIDVRGQVVSTPVHDGVATVPHGTSPGVYAVLSSSGPIGMVCIVP